MSLIIEKCNYCGCDDLKSVLKVTDHSVSKEEFDLLECFCCGLIQTSPQPCLGEIGTYYVSDQYVSHTDTKKGLINTIYHFARRWTLKKKFELIQNYHPEGTLLDVGCGTGYFASFMKSKGYQISVMEPDTDAAKKAEEKLHIEPYSNLEQVKSSYKIITMWHVLEHVHDLNATFKKLESLLDINGVLIIAVPNPESPDAIHYKNYWAAYDVPRHLYHYKKNVIRQMANKYNMQVTDILQMKLDSYYISMLSEKYKKGSILKAAFNGLLSNLKSGKDNSSSLIYIIQRNK
ncbi:MAG: class I SAM-dependent methyltransferase [Cytophagales bacterium]|nr:class I SAM-dependent methyltransferase [Cytophaga sp.]